MSHPSPLANVGRESGRPLALVIDIRLWSLQSVMYNHEQVGLGTAACDDDRGGGQLRDRADRDARPSPGRRGDCRRSRLRGGRRRQGIEPGYRRCPAGGAGDPVHGRRIGPVTAVRRAHCGPPRVWTPALSPRARVRPWSGSSWWRAMARTGSRSCPECSPTSGRTHLTGLDAALAGADVLLVGLEIPTATAFAALRIARARRVITVLNPAPSPDGPLAPELLALRGPPDPQPVRGGPPCRTAAGHRPAGAGDGAVLCGRSRPWPLTLGGDGVVLRHGGDVCWLDAVPARAVDTTGAGDAFNAAYAVRLGAGDPPREAARFAVRAAAVSVTRPTCRPVPAVPGRPCGPVAGPPCIGDPETHRRTAMKQGGILNAELSHAIACLGHGDGLLVVDAGFPIPCRRVADRPGALPGPARPAHRAGPDRVRDDRRGRPRRSTTSATATGRCTTGCRRAGRT